MTADSEAMVAALSQRATALRTITVDLPVEDAHEILWTVEIALTQIRDVVIQGSFITALSVDSAEARKVAIESLRKGASLASYARWRQFSWERRDVAAEILIEIMRAQEVLRRTDFFAMPHPDQ